MLGGTFFYQLLDNVFSSFFYPAVTAQQMKDNSILSFIKGLVITGVILVVVSLLYLLLTFDIAGGETVQEIENQRSALLVLAIIVAGLALTVVRQYLKKGKRSAAFGTGILPAVVLIPVIAYYANNFNYRTTFNKTTWEQAKWKPLDMAATLVKDKKLIGLTRIEIKGMLGQGVREHGDDKSKRGLISYLVKEDWTMTIFFEKDKVVDTQLRLPMMMMTD
jgi:hypothetical protein